MAAFVVTGITEIDQRLQELGNTIAKKIMRSAFRQALKPILAEAKSNAPVKTGDLRDAIKVRAMKRSRTTFGMEVQLKDGAYRGDQFYGSLQEWGWRTGHRGDSRNRHKVEGKHFMTNAYDNGKDQARQTAIDLIKEGIEEETNKLAGANDTQ